MRQQDYGYHRQLSGMSHAAALEAIRRALSEEGFGIITEIDMRATLKQKLDVDIPAYVILGACNPKLAHEALGQDPNIGLLLPCNVVVRETKDGVVVSAANPHAMFSVVDAPALGPLVEDVSQRVQRALAAMA